VSCGEHEVLDDGPERERRHVGQHPDQQNRPDQQHDEQGTVRGIVPSVTGTRFFAASAPAIASAATIGQNRPNHIARPVATLKKTVLAERPPNALPLLFAARKRRTGAR